MQALVNRIADLLATNPDQAAQGAALLLAVYVATLVPLLSWLFLGIFGRRPAKVEPAAVASNGKLQLPSPEQTALLIRKRRSVGFKDFSGEPVDRSKVEALLEAANWAPTHGKTEPWRWVVMQGSQLQEFADVTLQAIQESELPDKERRAAKLQGKRAKLGGVPWAIAICYKRQPRPDKRNPEWEEAAATACAVQNMHLLAAAMGLGGFWTSWAADAVRDAPAVKAWLGLGPEDRNLGVFYLGSVTPERLAGYRASRGPVADKVTWRA